MQRIKRQALTKLLQKCTNPTHLTQLHSLLLRLGLLTPTNSFFPALLTSTYTKLFSVPTALKLFYEIPKPSTFLYNSLLRAHSRSHQWKQCLNLLKAMKDENAKPDKFTLCIALKSCTGLSAFVQGKEIHALALKKELAMSDMFVGVALVELYSKCGDMFSARKVFVFFPQADTVLCTSVISGFEQNGLAREAISFFSEMIFMNFLTPSSVTLISVLSALGQIGDLNSGKSVHGYVIKMEHCWHNSPLLNAVLSFYVKLHAVDFAQKLFDKMPEKDIITWSCMICCYAHNGSPKKALKFYNSMVGTGLIPNKITLVSAIQACALALETKEGKKVHAITIHKGLELDVPISTALIDMYMKCSLQNDAHKLFDEIHQRDVVTWAALIGGFSLNNLSEKSLKIFNLMRLNNFSPDAVTIVKVLDACVKQSLQIQALCLHGYIIKIGFTNNLHVNAGLVNLYSKCGNLNFAIKIFEGVNSKDAVVYSSMIASYGMHGIIEKAMETFNNMINSSIKPNNITFVSLLSACSHAGLVQEGKQVYESMDLVYGVRPGPEHKVIIVDLLSRAGEVDEALLVVKHMNNGLINNPHALNTLLLGCTGYKEGNCRGYVN